MKIIYQQTDGSVAVITPAANCSLTDAETALKDVPTGLSLRLWTTQLYPQTEHFATLGQLMQLR